MIQNESESEQIALAAGRLWRRAQVRTAGRPRAVTDAEIARDTGLPLSRVRARLDLMSGVRFVVGHHGQTRTVRVLLQD